jgi:hypothetical protein
MRCLPENVCEETEEKQEKLVGLTRGPAETATISPEYESDTIPLDQPLGCRG